MSGHHAEQRVLEPPQKKESQGVLNLSLILGIR